jgi:hypothetical protein
VISIMQRNAAIGSMMQFVGNVSPDRGVQLSLLASALVTACNDFGVTRDDMLKAITEIYDNANDLVMLQRPEKLH